LHCRNTVRNSQRYLMDVGEKTLTALRTDSESYPV